jgi:hypothetical protein
MGSVLSIAVRYAVILEVLRVKYSYRMSGSVLQPASRSSVPPSNIRYFGIDPCFRQQRAMP